MAANVIKTILNSKSDLFKDVRYFLCDERNEKLKQLLRNAGAKREFYVSNLATHVISLDTTFPEYEQVKDLGIPIIKPDWVITCLELDTLLPYAPFSAEKDKLFSNVVACPSQIPPGDRDSLWAMVTFYGGKWQTVFNSSCTHLLVPKPDGDKYECAMKHIDKVKVVIPDWIIDCIKAKKLLDESTYAPVLPSGTQVTNVDESNLLTPENSDEGTTATVITPANNNPKVTPSSLLTPETPISQKGASEKSDSENGGTEKGSEKCSMEKGGSEKGDLEKVGSEEADSESTVDDKCHNETDSVQSNDKKSRQAAQFAKEKLKSISTQDSDKDDEENKEESIVVNDDRTQDRSKVIEDLSKDESPMSTDTFKTFLQEETLVASKLLSGCVFFISDYPQCIKPIMLRTWITIIKQQSGEVVPSYSTEKVTHLLCAHQHGKFFTKALKDGKLMVTAYWLNDVIGAQQIFPPKMPLHLPVPFKDKVSRCRNMIVSVTGFTGEERSSLKNMIRIVGAKYNNILTKSNTHLICRSESGPKFLKAKEWGVCCANARWLGDVMTGGCDYPVNMTRYRIFNDDNALDINIILARDLLEPWKRFEEKTDSIDKKRKLEILESEMRELENKKPRVEEKKEDLRTCEATKEENWPKVAKVVFTGLNQSIVAKLTEKLKSLGGEPAFSVKSCTHIVASKIMRTIKFLTGISVCQYIVSPDWIEQSYIKGHYVEEKDHILRDMASEKLYGMSLPDSIQKAQTRPLFKQMTIYVTPNVRPDQTSMTEIVQCAGGQLLVEMPPASSFKHLAVQKTDENRVAFVCVTCDDDLHMCREMKMQGIGVHNVEFVLSGILKQELDFFRYRL